MAIDLNKDIAVLNYNFNTVILVGMRDSYKLEPAGIDNDGDVAPSINYITAGDIRFINSGSNIFKIGYLRFEPESEEEVYEFLHIRDWQNIKTDAQIREDLRNPSVEILKDIVGIKSNTLLERYYIQMMALVDNDEDISGRVCDIIETRTKELRNGKITSDIVIKDRDANNLNANNKNAEYEKKLAEQSEQIEKLMAMLAKLTAAPSEEVSVEEKPTIKKRSSKKTKEVEETNDAI